MVDFGNALKTLRLRKNMTQAQLAQKLGITKSIISAYEYGRIFHKDNRVAGWADLSFLQNGGDAFEKSG